MMRKPPPLTLFYSHTHVYLILPLLQMWDLSTALELASKGTNVKPEIGGPTPVELVHILDACDLSNSRCTTPSVSPSPSFLAATHGGTVPHVIGTPQSSRRRLLQQVEHSEAPSIQTPLQNHPGSSMETSAATRQPEVNTNKDPEVDGAAVAKVTPSSVAAQVATADLAAIPVQHFQTVTPEVVKPLQTPTQRVAPVAPEVAAPRRNSFRTTSGNAIEVSERAVETPSVSTEGATYATKISKV